MEVVHLFFSDKPDSKWKLCQQMGVKKAFAKLAPELTGHLPPWDLDALTASFEAFRKGGFQLIGLEGDQMDMSRIKRGLPGRDEDIELYCKMLHNMGEVGIKTICYNFMVSGWYRNQVDIPERGGALVTGFDLDLEPTDSVATDSIPVEAVWENYRYFIQNVMPAAEKAGVKMALHPCDPPVESLAGVGRIFTDPAKVEAALSLVDSPNHQLTFCQGTYTTMGADVSELARRWAARDKIAFIHIRDVKGNCNLFRETFHDNGPTDMAEMFRLYHALQLNVPLRSDHVPTMAGGDNSQPGYGMEGSLFGIGYIRGLIDAIQGN